MKTVSAILLTLAIAIPATWFAARDRNHSHPAGPASAQAREPLYYQSSMHPWIKSDKPGRCTICGMELTPVYEGEAGFDAQGGEIAALSQSMIQLVGVRTEGVSVRPLKKTLRVAGTIEDDATRHRVLAAYVPGRIQRLHANFVGAQVTEGQPLAEFYSPALLQAEREYRSLTGDLRAATALRLTQMGLTPAQIEALPGKSANSLTTQILSPMTGTVVAQNVYEGQYVQEGEKLFEIADFAVMWFQFIAYERDLPWLKKGLPVEVTTPSHPGQLFAGKIAFIEPNLDAMTRSTKVRVELPNPPEAEGHRLLHRLYADGVVHLEEPEVLAAPRTAVLETGPEAVAYVDLGGGAYSRRVVKLGRRGDVDVEVLAGLAAGEKVVVNGNLLIDGQAEMNRSFGTGHARPAPPKTNAPALTDPQKQAAAALIQANDRAAQALAQDNLADFEAAAAAVMSATEGFAEALKSREDLTDLLTHLSEASHLHGKKDLAAARKAFHPFANVSAKILEELGRDAGAFEIFECPMVDRAIQGVPKQGRWVQARGREIGNPYFGSEMLDCGTTVTP